MTDHWTTRTPPSHHLSCVSVEEARKAASLVSECGHILEPFYESYRVPLDYALSHEGERLYTERDADGRLLAFFVADAPKTISRDLPPVAYMGLTAQRDDSPNANGAARRLWVRFLADMRALSPEGDTLVWYRTATPFGLYPCYQLLTQGQPARDGTFTAEMAHVALSLREALMLGGQPSDHPFVLRGVAAARYSAQERERINRYSDGDQANPLTILGVNERQGDRLLMVGCLPK